MMLDMAADKVKAEMKLEELLEKEETDLVVELEEDSGLGMKKEEIVEVYTQLKMATEEVKEPEKIGDILKEALAENLFSRSSAYSWRVLQIFLQQTLRSPLPETESLCLKFGLNKWEAVDLFSMKKFER